LLERTDFINKGTDAQLAAALSGSNLLNAAEIIRYTYNDTTYSGGWSSSSISTFSAMVNNVILPPASQTTPSADQEYPFEANWGTSGEKFMLAAAVFLEDTTLYNDAKTLILSSACANLSGTISSTGQSSESGRDQQHTQLGLGNLVEAFTIMDQQYDPSDFFAELDNRLMVGLEYTANYLMGGTVPYSEDFVRCDADLLGGPWATISSSGLTPIRPVWEAAYAHYVNVKGLSMPYTKALVRSNLAADVSFTNGVEDRSQHTRWAKSSRCNCGWGVFPNFEIPLGEFRALIG
jgi:hypothetical protein